MKKNLSLTLGLISVFLLSFMAMPCRAKSLYEKSFEIVWQTVNAKHYDATFGGKDWKAIRDRYETKVSANKSDIDFYTITNNMLFDLNLSHLLVVSHRDLKQYLSNLFANGSIGVDIRWLDEQAVVTSVTLGSSAADAGLRPGYVIVQVGSDSIEEIVAKTEDRLIPPFNIRNKRNNISLQILGRIYGKPETDVSIVFLDSKGRRYAKTITRKSRGPGRVLTEALPPFFIEFEAKKLDDDIGYIRFNQWAI